VIAHKCNFATSHKCEFVMSHILVANDTWDMTHFRIMRHVSRIICECVMSYLAYEYKVSHISHMNKSQMIRETWHIYLCVKSQMNSTARSTECLCARHSAKSSHSVELRIFRQKSCVYSAKRALCSKHSAKSKHSVEFDSLSKSVLTTVCKVKTFCRIRLNVLTTFSRIRRISRRMSTSVCAQDILKCFEHRALLAEYTQLFWRNMRVSTSVCAQDILKEFLDFAFQNVEFLDFAFRMSWAQTEVDTQNAVSTGLSDPTFLRHFAKSCVLSNSVEVDMQNVLSPWLSDPTF